MTEQTNRSVRDDGILFDQFRNFDVLTPFGALENNIDKNSSSWPFDTNKKLEQNAPLEGMHTKDTFGFCVQFYFYTAPELITEGS